MAEIWLYPTSEGGRQGATPADAFGCLFELGGELFDCRIILGEVGPLRPGQKATVPIRFLLRDLVYELQPGQTFYLREINRIGEGKIVTVFEP